MFEKAHHSNQNSCSLRSVNDKIFQCNTLRLEVVENIVDCLIYERTLAVTANSLV